MTSSRHNHYHPARSSLREGFTPSSQDPSVPENLSSRQSPWLGENNFSFNPRSPRPTAPTEYENDTRETNGLARLQFCIATLLGRIALNESMS